MENKHTPGPWEVSIYEEYPTLHTIWSKKEEIPTLIARTCYAPRSEYNANLIAAAPELLEALQEIKSAISLSPYAEKVDFDYPSKTYDSSFGGGDCSKHGRYYGVCHCCKKDHENARKDADRIAFWEREDSIRTALNKANEVIRKATDNQSFIKQ